MKERKKVFLKRKLSGAPEEKNVVYFFNTHDDVYRNRTRLRCVSGAVIKEEKKLYKYDEYKNESIQHKREARRKQNARDARLAIIVYNYLFQFIHKTYIPFLLTRRFQSLTLDLFLSVRKFSRHFE